MAFAPGTKLGSYEIQSPLGVGGMGEVYRATDTKLGRDVALKVLPAEMAHDPERLARFRREAKTLAQLDHPNIVTIYSVEECDGRSEEHTSELQSHVNLVCRLLLEKKKKKKKQ